ncbi:hypothetical protein S40285_00047 [Stachybotrys chlorohalonatus IBT 40285]|uniref:Uncharacterized protein n=1 Tax=Stachybotrys chlorohalonatus (strain IBT 40285) TaxID=1283841 RepID=A0A084QYZ9_STAC4|nr:hypothetical protein S40285_00047 [Stachybotrys chlorohalonata IBT 40285]
MAPKAPSAGTKVTPGQDAPEYRENAGFVASDSLAAESKREGGGFSENSQSENLTSSSSNNNKTSSNTSSGNASSSTTARSTVESQSAFAGTAPTYVADIRDSSGPHGKNLQEGGFGDSKAEDGLKKAFAAEPGSENDPSRQAELDLLSRNAGGRDSAPNQGGLTNESAYDALNSETSA